MIPNFRDVSNFKVSADTQQKIPINEYFETLQGEATHQGKPSLFIRLQGCPVFCSFCDTKYTWTLDSKFEVDDIEDIIQKQSLDFTKGEGNQLHIKRTSAEIYSMCIDASVDHIVFTGGEPCMYDLTYVTFLLHEYKRYQAGKSQKRFSTQIETSGTYHVRTHPSTWVTVSPKVGKSIKGKLPLIPQALEVKPISKAQQKETSILK